ncbi:unnamed protein product [Eruca vesicaria subsp. sativa]|uniref:Uncharacterized protein n=1 Tax=Eruca vesicaria subsp. sativa TaxID=29727 RepID=A0ABC8LDQ3_ERUVS|nr:unnamed protein product [Eruca vesicaria subsp. sativa]
MDEIKMEDVLNDCMVKAKCLRETLNRVTAHSSFSVQWKDLDEYLESVKGQVNERFRELDSKEVELKDQTFALEEMAKVVEEAEGRLADLEVKSERVCLEVEGKRKELNFLKNQVEISRDESNVEEVRLSQLRTLVEECEAERMLKESQLSEMVESWRKTHVKLGLNGEELAKMVTNLERSRDEVSEEMTSLHRIQTHRRQLDEEVERKTKDLTLVQNKLVECEHLL